MDLIQSKLAEAKVLLEAGDDESVQKAEDLLDWCADATARMQRSAKRHLRLKDAYGESNNRDDI